jgi:dipeptidase D
MSQDIRTLEPRALWNHFADLNTVPRPSKKEERVIQFIRGFGERLGLETRVDDIGNVIIRKPASPGMEHRVPIVMQAHLDMVCQKNAGTDFDFERQGIDMYVDGDWVKARGTTLGADNGLGVASIMTILAANDIDHPALEALFTIDEETGMTGAKGLQPGLLHGKILLNLDTEEDDELTIGCAGGVDVASTRAYSPENTPQGMAGYRILVRGLKGGHSGGDIHLGRANANKVMNRLLWGAARRFGLRVAEIDGGGLRNAIPRESLAIVAVPAAQSQDFEAWLREESATICVEYATTDPDANTALEKVQPPWQVVPLDVQRLILGTIYACPNGVHRMSPEMEGLVQTSNNLARVLVKEGGILIGCLTRSAVNSERDDLAQAVQANFELAGAKVEFAGAYPGWQPAPHSAIVEILSRLHEELFHAPARVLACHGGLECGILGAHYPDMEMISFGPNIRGAHSPDECTQISSVQKYWRFLLETLKRIPRAE